MFVLPKGDLKIIDPARMDALPPEGRDVGTDNPAYWNRHLTDDSIEIVPADKVPAAIARLEKADAARAEESRVAREANKAAADAAAKADPKKPAAPAAQQK